MKKCILGTVFLKSKNFKRYINWINYYGFNFKDFDLFLANDGDDAEDRLAVNEILKSVDESIRPRVNFLFFGPPLGRVSHCMFPGWRRSFKELLKEAGSKKYDKVIFIETDLYIRKKYIKKYTDLFDEEIYCAGFSDQHNMMETSLQILNDNEIRNALISFFETGKELMSNVCSEPQIQSAFNPIINRTKGTRLEGGISNMHEWEFYAQCDYDTYKNYIEEI